MTAPIPVSPVAGRPWTKDEDNTLVNLWDRYMGKPDIYRRLAHKLGRTPRAVQFHANTLGLYHRADGKSYMDLHDLCRLFGRTLNAVWQQWGKGPRYRRHCIPVDDLWAWMEQPKTWHLWEPETLGDLAWREHFTELRQDWLSTEAVCKLCGVSKTAVLRWRKRGRVRHVGSKRQRWHWRADVEQLRHACMTSVVECGPLLCEGK